MSTATLTSKGQITIPVGVRNDLKVDAGDRVEFIQIAPGRYEFVVTCLVFSSQHHLETLAPLV